MLRTLAILSTVRQTVVEADLYEKQSGRRGRLLVLVTYPAKMVVIYLSTQAIARVMGPVRRVLGRPVTPTEERISAAWLSLLANAGIKGSPVWGGVSLSALDEFSTANMIGFGGKTRLAHADALSEIELNAVLVHELAHLRLRHVIIVSFAIAALSAGWPVVVRRLIARKTPQIVESLNYERMLAREIGLPYTSESTASVRRDYAATAVSVVTIALVVSAIQRACETQADDYAAAVVGTDPLTSAIKIIDNANTARNSRPGIRAAFWRFDAAVARTIGIPFASAPSSASRIKRLKSRSGTDHRSN